MNTEERMPQWAKTAVLTQSSNASLTRETKSTRLKGTTFVIGDTGLHDQNNT